MPRIDPLQLLTCLQVLLTPSGGVLSKQEVARLASLMTKFSKKLVSKCVYVLILKNTERQLLGDFMAAGGWTLIQVWLHDAMYNTNWALVKELLELLLITPVDVGRLKSNNIPKLVKSLSKRDDLAGIHDQSSRLVQQWLKIVKDETQTELANQQQQQQASHAQTEMTVNPPIEFVEVPVVNFEQSESGSAVTGSETEQSGSAAGAQPFYKLTVRDGKQVLSKVAASEATYTVVENAVIEEVDAEEQKENEKNVVVKEEKVQSDAKPKHKSSSSSSSKSSSSSRDKHRSSRDSRTKSKDRHHSDSSSSSSSNKDKSRSKDRDRKDRDRHRSNGSVKDGKKSSSSSSDKKENKERQAEKDKDTLAKVQPSSVLKLPKIPKKSDDKSKSNKDSKKEEPKKGTMSVEVRKTEERPKTVKIFNAKMRSTGLEEEAKPAPPRATKKPASAAIAPPPIYPTVATLKRPSPTRDLGVPPEKKLKIEGSERLGAIKLTPPKPKPAVLQESDMFMDALTASATTKKEPKKRKRRASVSKDSSGSSPPQSPSVTQTGANGFPLNSPIGLKNITPPKFYQDTLENSESNERKTESTSENGESNQGSVEDSETGKDERATTPTETNEEVGDGDNFAKDNNASGVLKGVLVHTKKKGPKKSIKWKADDELVDIQYFELDETERVNVSKNFGDMAKLDVREEREFFQKSRKLPSEDLMDTQTSWKLLIELDLENALAIPGSKSFERDIQFAREKSVLQALYFNKSALPDSPGEPEHENHQMSDPIMIPTDDPVPDDHDFRNEGWPEPKGSPPPPKTTPTNVPQVFQNVPNQFPNFPMGGPPLGYPNMQPQYQGQGFVPPNMMAHSGAGEWNPMANSQMLPPNMAPTNMAPPELMSQVPMNPNMYPPPNPDGYNQMMNDNGAPFQPQFHQHGPGMYPVNNNFNNNVNTNRGGRGGFRRGGGSGPWIRMNGPVPGGWNNHMRGSGGNRGGRLCKNVKNRGYCRNRDNCPFVHPN